MHEIFINYRTKGGKSFAYMCHEVLANRFGEDSVFLARKSIAEGTDFTQALLRGARDCRVLLALIDEEWLNAPDRRQPDRRALDNPDDWVRREIEEALASGAVVVPLLIARKVEQLDARTLPHSIAELAQCQYARVGHATLAEDLNRLADSLVRRIPALATLDRAQRAASDDHQPDSGVHTDQQSGGIGNVGGSVGTFVNEAHAPFHTGRGNIYGGPHFSGDGTNYIAGDNHGGIRQGFGTRMPRGGDER